MQPPDCEETENGASKLHRYACGAWLALALGAALSVAAAILMWLNMLPLGIAGQWFWPLRGLPIPIGGSTGLGVILIAWATGYVLYLLALRAAPKPDQYVIAVLLCCLAAFSMMTGLYMGEQVPYMRVARTVCSVSALPYYGEAVATGDVRELLRNYGAGETQTILPDRIRTHPPGTVLYFSLARRLILNSPTLLQVGKRLLAGEGIHPADLPLLSHGLTPIRMTADDVAAGFLAGLFLTLAGTLIPAGIFLIATAVSDKKTASVAALLSAAIPSLLLFVPSIEGFGVLIVMCALGTYLWSLRRGSYALAAISGLLWVATFLWSIGLLVLALPAAAVLVSYLKSAPAPDETRLTGEHTHQAHSQTAAFTLSAVALAVFVAAFIVLYLATGYRPLANMRHILQAQAQIMTGTGRDHLTWTFMNLYEFGLFLGPMLAVTSLAGLICAMSCKSTKLTWNRCPSSRPMSYMGAGLLVAFLLLDAMGSTRGEVGRIWVFFMPLFALYAAHLRIYLADKLWRWYLAALLAAQVAHTILLFAYIIPVQA
jgi:hypothetical protein